uniref:Uncharacterized protein n=2 Tax=Candidatus Bipolaricaulota TaxID=67810 RepID=H5SH54_9BACT|nr:hypothetical protein HGMM_F27H04C48 [uncultured Acetothermia bacterium]BAL60229.1 hypothetical protein HGMM_OP4C865 [Candidatus Acetothermum autotrophicum]
MRNVKRVLERYHTGELSVYDVARALKISLLHAERLIEQAQSTLKDSRPAEAQVEKK